MRREEIWIGKEVTKGMRERVLEELAAIGFAKATDLLVVENGELTVRDTKKIPKKLRAAVASIEKAPGGVKLKLYDKLKALELLGKFLGLFDGSGGEQVEENNLIEQILSATGEEVDTCDLPEVQQAAAHRHELVEPAGAEGV